MRQDMRGNAGSLKYVVRAGSIFCWLSAWVILFVVVRRLPAVAQSPRDILFGTMMAATLSVMIAAIALLIEVAYMVYQIKKSREPLPLD